jgi:hypothetical protein
MNIYLQLTEEMNRGRLRAVIASGQAEQTLPFQSHG